MLYRRYGESVHSVTPNFDSRALNEISFRRDGARSLTNEEFEQLYERVREEEVDRNTEGPVQSEAEAELLALLEAELQSLMEGLEEGEVMLVENQQGVDWPKLRDRKQGIIVDGDNRLYFEWRVEPTLRVGLYRERAP